MTKDVRFTISAKDETAKAISSARKGLNSLGKIGAVAGLAFGAAVVSGYGQAATEIDALAKQSSFLGVAAKELQILQHHAELSGVKVESLTDGLKSMSEKVAEAAMGTGEAVNALKLLGLSADDLVRLSPDDQIRKISDAMAGMENASQKAYVANKLFGGSGAQMINMLNGGAEAMDAAGSELERYGVLLSELDTRKIEMANDQMTRAKTVFKGVTNQLAIQMAPIVSEITTRFLNMAGEVGGVDQLVRKFIGFGVKGVGVFADGVHGLKIGFMLVRVAVANLITQILEIPKAIASGGSWLAEKLGFEADALNTAVEMMDSFKETTQSFWADLNNEALQPLPSEKIAAWYEDLNSKFTEQAAQMVRNQGAIANDAILKTLPVDTEDEDPYGFGKEDPFVTAEEKRQEEIAAIRQQWRDTELKQEAEHQAKMQQFMAMSSASKVKTIISEGVALTQGAANTSRKLFKINKALALADAAVTLPSAVLKAVERGGGWPWGAAFGALTLANGMAQINAIRSANFSGGGGTSASLAGSGGGATPVRDVDAAPSGTARQAPQQSGPQYHIYGDIYGMERFEDKVLNLVARGSDNNQIRIEQQSGRFIIHRT